MNQQFGQKTPGEDTSLSGAQVVSLLGFGAMLVGSFLPWVRADILEANGTEGEGVLPQRWQWWGSSNTCSAD